MALSCGFYNSSNGDRKYDSVQISHIFDGIITDGIYATYEKAMVVKASENAGEVIIQPGRAWFNHSWSYNDADYVMEAPAPEVLLDRIDALVLDVNSEMATRDNVFMWVTGTPASNPERPSLIRSVTHNQYPLCYVRRYAETTMIYAKDITNTVGTSDCPFVTGVLEGINIDDLLAQWDDEFHTWENATKTSFEGWMVNQETVYTAWWDALKNQMAGDVADVEAWVQTIRGIIDSEAATHLQAEIDELNEWVPNGSYLRIVTEEQELFSRAVTISDLAGHSQTENFDANGAAIFKSFPYVGTLNIASSNGARTAVQTITVPYFTRMENVQLAFWSATVNIEADIEMAGYTVTVKDSNDATVTAVVLNANAEGIFRAQAPDTYKFQVTYGGETMEVSLAVTEETTYSVSISAGFNWRNWVTLGGLNPSSYSSLEDVFENEIAVRRLMTIHASADYLIDTVANDIDTIDDFCASDNAMKWIGLRDYVCDGLTAINGVEAKFLASQYWERYLKDHVPTMTSNTAPYGTASAYQVFDGSTSTTASATDFRYKFTNPICVKKFESSASGGTLQASNDGSTWITITTPSENTDYYLYYGVHYNASTSVNTIQFYGRSLDVSVPAMTGYTLPYGEVIYSSDLSNQQAYKAFDDNPSTTWSASTVNYDSYIGYRFSTPVVVDTIVYTKRVISGYNEAICTAKIQGSNDGSEWEDLTEILTFDQLNTVAGTKHIWKVTKNKGAHRYHKLQFISGGDRVNPTAVDIQFYGVDYSEREFEVGTNKKWLYDHGVNLENLEAYVVNPASGDGVTFENDYIDVHYTGVSGSGRRTVAKTSMDLTNYELIKAVIDDFGASSLLIGVLSSDSSTSSIAQVNLTKPFNYFDISSVDSNVSVQVGRWVSGNTGYGKVKELWLE